MREKRGRRGHWYLILPLCVSSAGCAEAPSTESDPRAGGQTGSGGQPLPLGCGTSDADCARIFSRAFPALYDSPSIARAECVRASRVDDSFRDDTPLCRCTYQLPPSPYADTPREASESSVVIGLARRRMLRGEPGDTCEYRLDYWGAPDTCLLEARDFEGCSLGDGDGGCASTCRLARDQAAQIGAEMSARIEFLGAKRTCCDSGYDSSTLCVGAVRVNDQCGVAAQGTADPSWPIPLFSLRQVSCDQSVEAMLEQGTPYFTLQPLQCPAGPGDAGTARPESPDADAAVVLDASTVGSTSPASDAALSTDAAPAEGGASGGNTP